MSYKYGALGWGACGEGGGGGWGERGPVDSSRVTRWRDGADADGGRQGHEGGLDHLLLLLLPIPRKAHQPTRRRAALPRQPGWLLPHPPTSPLPRPLARCGSRSPALRPPQHPAPQLPPPPARWLPAPSGPIPPPRPPPALHLPSPPALPRALLPGAQAGVDSEVGHELVCAHVVDTVGACEPRGAGWGCWGVRRTEGRGGWVLGVWCWRERAGGGGGRGGGGRKAKEKRR